MGRTDRPIPCTVSVCAQLCRATSVFSHLEPDRPKRLKPALLRKYRRERRDFTVECAKHFGLAFQVIDRMDGAPRVMELVYESGEVEPVDLPYLLRAVH